MSDTPPFLPYGRHVIEDDDVAAVVEVLRGDFLTTGPRVEAFEKALAECTGAEHAVACSSGTAALHLAALAVDLGPGDVAVVPAVTFVATAAAVLHTGADVVFADVDPDSGLMGPAHLEAALAGARDLGRPRAVLPVHLAGRSTDMAAIGAIADRDDLVVIEDACHALGGTDVDGARVGACRHGAMSAFSFHPVKTVAAGEGGAVTTNDAALAERMRGLRSHGVVRDPGAFVHPELALDDDGGVNPWVYEVRELAFNYRLSDIACALGLSQLAKLDRFLARREALARRYHECLAPLAPLVKPTGEPAAGRSGRHLMVALIDFDRLGLSRRRVMERLRERGIGTQVHYIPVPSMPALRRRYGEKNLPGTEAYYRRCLSLPLHAGMTDDDVRRVCDALDDIVAQGGGGG